MAIQHGIQLIESGAVEDWERALESYPTVIEQQGVSDLATLDSWYRDDLPTVLATRAPAYMSLEELSQVVRWKMRRGEWRARNLALVRGNSEEDVIRTSTVGLNPETPPSKALNALVELAGVGPATASAALAASRPAELPFLDDLVGAAIPSLGTPAFTTGYYFKYAAALAEIASRLGAPWTAQRVGLALWSAIGGKAALK